MTWDEHLHLPEGWYLTPEAYRQLTEARPMLTLISDDWGEMDTCLRNGWSIWEELPDAPKPWQPSWERALEEAGLL